MKVVAITDKIDSAYGWWRIKKPFLKLRKYDIDATWCWLDENDSPTENVEGAVVVLQRVICKTGPLNYAKAFVDNIRRQGARAILYEMDDDIISEGYIQYMKQCGRMSEAVVDVLEDEIKRTVAIINECDGVTTTTVTLGNIIEKVTHKKAYILPNSLDLNWYRTRLSETIQWDDSLVTIGWAGGLRPREDFVDMCKAWKRIAQEFTNVKFVVAGYQPDVIYESVPFESIVWIPFAKLDEWPKSMQVDIGCCPLANTAFNRCKSPIKAVEYSMAGAAVVASPVVYEGSRFGDSILYARNEDYWYKALKHLIKNKEAREAYVDKAQKIVIDHYNLAKNWINWRGVYRLVV